MTDAPTVEPTTPADQATRPQTGSNFIWYELVSADIAQSKAFYDTVVGWTIDGQSSMPDGTDYRMIKRADGGNAGGVMQLTEDMRSKGARPTWLGYIHVDDVEAEISRIKADGGMNLMGPMDIPEAGRIAMVADPQGAIFYIMKPTPPADNPDATSDVFSTDQAQHVRWNELASSDQDGAVDFYTRHFGWKQDGAMPMGEMGDYKFIYAGDTRIGAMMRKPPQLPVSLWTFYIGVDDIDRASKAVTDGGGQITHGPMEIPGGEFSLVGLDPQGAPFGLVGPRHS